MIDDVLLQWQKMSGLTDKHKQVNALLTAVFISRRDMPRDECLVETVDLLELQRVSPAWPDSGQFYLKRRFASAVNPETQERTAIPSLFKFCDALPEKVDSIMASEESLPTEELVELVKTCL